MEHLVTLALVLFGVGVSFRLHLHRFGRRFGWFLPGGRGAGRAAQRIQLHVGI